MRQADVDFVVRTDLAIEERERVWESGSEIAGVRMREWEAADAGIRVTEVLVCDERGEEALGKPVGVYLTLDAPSLAKKDEDYHREVSEELSGLLRGMFVDHGLEAERMERPVRTLVVGLGNPEATPDALGPKVLEHLQATPASGDGVRDGFLLEAWISDPEWDHTGSHGADGDGNGGDRKGDRAGDRAGCRYRCGCAGGQECGETRSHGAACRYGDPTGIRGRKLPERADGGDAGDPGFCDRDSDGCRGGGDRVRHGRGDDGDAERAGGMRIR